MGGDVGGDVSRGVSVSGVEATDAVWGEVVLVAVAVVTLRSSREKGMGEVGASRMMGGEDGCDSEGESVVVVVVVVVVFVAVAVVAVVVVTVAADVALVDGVVAAVDGVSIDEERGRTDVFEAVVIDSVVAVGVDVVVVVIFVLVTEMESTLSALGSIISGLEGVVDSAVVPSVVVVVVAVVVGGVVVGVVVVVSGEVVSLLCLCECLLLLW